jgi:hypothetical protein
LNDLYIIAGGRSPAAPAQRPAARTSAGVYESDQAYFTRRSAEERACAEQAGVEGRAAHLELAELYAGLAAAIGEAQDKIG